MGSEEGSKVFGPSTRNWRMNIRTKKHSAFQRHSSKASRPEERGSGCCQPQRCCGHRARFFFARAPGRIAWGAARGAGRGIASVFSIPNPAIRQIASRVGGTISVPYSKHQTAKLSYSAGTYSRFGGNYRSLQVAWQYSWIGERW